MTPRDARKAGEQWGLSEARADHAGDHRTANVYRTRWHEALNELTPDLRDAMWAGHDAAYDAEWARLEETGNANG